MIKFIDLRDQDIGVRFAFWDSDKNKFVGSTVHNAWNDWDDFKETYGWSELYLDAFLLICPKWVFDKEIEDDNSDR